MDNIGLFSCGIYLLTNESVGDGRFMLHTVGASDVVICKSSQVSIRVNCMNQIM